MRLHEIPIQQNPSSNYQPHPEKYNLHLLEMQLLKMNRLTHQGRASQDQLTDNDHLGASASIEAMMNPTVLIRVWCGSPLLREAETGEIMICSQLSIALSTSCALKLAFPRENKMIHMQSIAMSDSNGCIWITRHQAYSHKHFWFKRELDQSVSFLPNICTVQRSSSA